MYTSESGQPVSCMHLSCANPEFSSHKCSRIALHAGWDSVECLDIPLAVCSLTLVYVGVSLVCSVCYFGKNPLMLSTV